MSEKIIEESIENHIVKLMALAGTSVPLLRLLESIPADRWDPEKEVMGFGKNVNLLDFIFDNMREKGEFFLDFLSMNKNSIKKETILHAIECGMLPVLQMSSNTKHGNRIKGDVWFEFAKSYLEKQGVDKKEVADKFLELAIKVDSLELVELAIKDGGVARGNLATVKSVEVLIVLMANGESLGAGKDKRKKSVSEIILSREDRSFKDMKSCKAIRAWAINSQIEAGEESQKKLITMLINHARVEDVVYCLKKFSKEAWLWKLEDDESILFKIVKSRMIWDVSFHEKIQEIPRFLWTQKNNLNKSPLSKIFVDFNEMEYVNESAWIEVVKNIDIKSDLVPLFMSGESSMKLKYPLGRYKENALCKQWTQEFFEGIAQSDHNILLNCIWKNDLSYSDRGLDSREWRKGLKSIGATEIKRLNLSGLKFGIEIGVELEKFIEVAKANQMIVVGGVKSDLGVEVESVINKKLSKDGEMVLKHFSNSIPTLSEIYKSKEWIGVQRIVEKYILKIDATNVGVDMKRKSKPVGAL